MPESGGERLPEYIYNRVLFALPPPPPLLPPPSSRYDKPYRSATSSSPDRLYYCSYATTTRRRRLLQLLRYDDDCENIYKLLRYDNDCKNISFKGCSTSGFQYYSFDSLPNDEASKALKIRLDYWHGVYTATANGLRPISMALTYKSRNYDGDPKTILLRRHGKDDGNDCYGGNEEHNGYDGSKKTLPRGLERRKLMATLLLRRNTTALL
ncbi:hypothetical protein QBC39DRAFT_334429 [Podospora conica]|nr:hypothetical protein QBC39DRAFT_334429 [Schizothecium conicum]